MQHNSKPYSKRITVFVSLGLARDNPPLDRVSFPRFSDVSGALQVLAPSVFHLKDSVHVRSMYVHLRK